MNNPLTIALIGNPNCGKTSLFNVLTGSRQHVGNWPGVTVERIEGYAKYGAENIRIVDLPGIYGLSASSEDELVAVNYILNEKPDLVVNVVDSTNIERNLYLTMQLLELNTKLIIALNMTDEAKKKHIDINKDELSKTLGVPVVATVATRREGIDQLLETVVRIRQAPVAQMKVDYGPKANEVLADLDAELKACRIPKDSAFTVAVKLLEDERYAQELSDLRNCPALIDKIEASRNLIREISGFEPDIYFAEKRYESINRIVKACVKQEARSTMDLSERIDRVVTNKWLGIPIFLLVMFLLYQITMGFGNEFLGSYVGDFFAFLGSYLNQLLAESNPLFRSFIVDGIIGGVGSVLAFVPLMFTMYFLISLLEDSGYMARAAYVMDRLMTALGLHGKTAVSMIVGSGCNVAGIMSTRTLDSHKDRMIGILISPFISCSARLPVYALFAGAFFGSKKVGFLPASGVVFFSLYVLGVVVAVTVAKILSKTVFKQEKSYFIMELPPYRIPTLKNLLLHMWEKTRSFVIKAGTIVFGIVVLIWILSVFPQGVEPGSADSILGKIGTLIAPILHPAGFGSWEAAVALIVGVGAKEAIVATFGMVYGAGEDILATVLQNYFTPLSAYAFMAMTLLYSPCAATIGVIKKETNSLKWALFSIAYSLLIGWIVAVVIYQAGIIFGGK